MYPKSLAIFDLDGTLVNTIPDLGNACDYALSNCGFPTHSPLAYRSMVGNGISRLIERALPEDSRDAKTIESVRKKFVEFYDKHLWDESTCYPGIPELLDNLNSKGVHLAVASNKYQDATKRIVEHFFPDIPWVAIIGQQEGLPLKPDPSIVFKILSECPTPKTEAIFIGDSAVDMETAYRACIDRIGVTWGFRGRAELLTARADFIVSSTEEIMRYIHVKEPKE